MIKQIIINFLERKLQEKKHEVVRLRWEKAELENKLRGIGK